MTDVFRLKTPEIFDGLAKPKIFEKGEIIYVQGDDAEYIYYLKSGKVQIYVGSARGSEKILATFSGGSLFGKSAFFDNLPRASNARALKKSEIIRVNKQMMTQIIGSYPKFAVDMLEYLSKTIRVFSNQIESMSFLQADKRVAMYLIDNLPAAPEKNISCTHDEIAAAIGASRVTVSKILSRFAADGLIKTLYKSVCVNDTEALKDVSCDGWN